MPISYRNELYRKSIHLCALSMPVGFYLFSKSTAIPVISAALLVTIYIDMSRIYKLPGGKFLNGLISPVLREHEQNTFSGAFYILLSGLLAVIFLEVPLAASVMGFVILGDIVAALVGRRWGRIGLPGTNKTLEGSIGCLAICILVAVIAPGLPLRAGIPGAITAAIAEAYCGKIDDNLAMVIASGAVMVLLL